MKTLKLIITALTFQLLLWNAPAYGQLIALVGFMKVPQGGESEYRKLEREIWKPMHQEWVNQGKMAGWYLWYVPYPSGTNAEYHYVLKPCAS